MRGRATIHDREVLIFCTSQLVAAQAEAHPAEPTLCTLVTMDARARLLESRRADHPGDQVSETPPRRQVFSDHAGALV